VLLLMSCLCRPNVVCTPHLGASTTEAQEGVSTEVAEAVVDALQGKLAATAVNAPMVSPEVLKELAPFVTLAEALGKVRGCAQGKGAVCAGYLGGGCGPCPRPCVEFDCVHCSDRHCQLTLAPAVLDTDSTAADACVTSVFGSVACLVCAGCCVPGC
jgi:hypothetical protein